MLIRLATGLPHNCLFCLNSTDLLLFYLLGQIKTCQPNNHTSPHDKCSLPQLLLSEIQQKIITHIFERMVHSRPLFLVSILLLEGYTYEWFPPM